MFVFLTLSILRATSRNSILRVGWETGCLGFCIPRKLRCALFISLSCLSVVMFRSSIRGVSYSWPWNGQFNVSLWTWKTITPSFTDRFFETLNGDEWRMDNYTNTSTPASDEPPVFAPDYRITATVLHSIIFLLGLFGNILVVIVVRRNKNMHIPTYTYLVSTVCN